MLVLRSLLFNAAFYLSTLVQMLVLWPYYFSVSRAKAWSVPNNWSRLNSWLLEKICGTRVVFKGVENIPDGPCIIAAKHQSSWDTFVFVPHLKDPVYILKRQLMWIPFFGWYLAKMNMIAIDRASRDEARKQVAEGANAAKRDGRQIVIYPEGTRRAPGDTPAYKQGVAMIYEATGLPVVPIAHNAGLFWPRRKFLRHPGTMTVEFLPPIPPGLKRDDMFKRLISELEARCDALLVEAATAPDAPPLPETALRRLNELGVTLKQ
ncbi:MAG: 1-acyl-sn-glycerol-3-phosphate acyltransferase [Rhizobiaceae bacterium]|jgi:1-acyl-sn-glycerol-3-phosphate acyltransferase|nr:1-acyl-sn-glycerol-3-phosphate acyltransferase [Rhizobiaceae bacterium]